MKHISYPAFVAVCSAFEEYVAGLEDPLGYLFLQVNGYAFGTRHPAGVDKRDVLKKAVLGRAWDDPDGRTELVELAVLCHYRWQSVETTEGVLMVVTPDVIADRTARIRTRFGKQSVADGTSESKDDLF